MYQIVSTSNYLEWFEQQTLKTRMQIMARLNRIIEQGHFGDAKHIDGKLAELRWKNGMRIYFALKQNPSSETAILLLIGGNKKTQKKDIEKAKKLVLTLSKVYE